MPHLRAALLHSWKLRCLVHQVTVHDERRGELWVTDAERIVGSLQPVEVDLLRSISSWSWFRGVVARKHVACCHAVMWWSSFISTWVRNTVGPRTWSPLQIFSKTANLAPSSDGDAGSCCLADYVRPKHRREHVRSRPWSLVIGEGFRPGRQWVDRGRSIGRFPGFFRWVCTWPRCLEGVEISWAPVEWIGWLAVFASHCHICWDQIGWPWRAVFS